jgi:hypothetical protein
MSPLAKFVTFSKRWASALWSLGSVADPDPPEPHVLGLLDPDPDPLVRDMDPAPDPSIIMQK